MSKDDARCEAHFLATHTRLPDGRHTVRLPFKDEVPIFGQSCDNATSIFASLEKRLERIPPDRTAYHEFMSNYEKQSHMSVVSPQDSAVTNPYYLPHHGVKRESSTTPLRVVFNASSKNPNGFSLNDTLLVGPKLQTDITSVLTQWRRSRFVFSADITQMYRQIWVDPRDRDFQRIVWRYNPNQPILHYQLNTVTFGVSCASFLAMRVLQQLIQEDGPRYPYAMSSLHSGLYVDDCLFGADDLESIRELRLEVVRLLLGGGFELRKWASNARELLTEISPVNHGLACDKSLLPDEGIKILGVYWNPNTDMFHYRISLEVPRTYTKRTLLSIIARLYDPLGWAVLLARMMKTLVSQPQFAAFSQHCWTDATIVLDWLKLPPTRWKTFVANRVSEVQVSIPKAVWHHVPTTDNPADLASRGALPRDLVKSHLWLQGPEWLRASEDQWPTLAPPSSPDAPMEERIQIHTVNLDENDTLNFLAARVSDWQRLLRITGYILFWRNRIRQPRSTPLHLTSSVIEHASIIWYRWLQSSMFPEELASLKSGSNLPRHSPLNSLTPFFDNKGIIRVGGRLQEASLSYDASHPVILRAHPVVTILVQRAHNDCLHGGISLTLQTLRNSVWIIQARKIIRSVVYHCIACTRLKAKAATQLMGSLPSPRVLRPARPFQHCGVDYAGPIRVRYGPGRGQKSHSAYIALFVCLSVKAIHLEVVSDYSSATFLDAFTRFTSRRGVPSDMYSDQSTTFIGADSALTQAFENAVQSSSFQALLTKNRISWHFISPAAPNFGGLWEAGVKSAKAHLYRLLGDHTPTFEEVTTLLC